MAFYCPGGYVLVWDVKADQNMYEVKAELFATAKKMVSAHLSKLLQASMTFLRKCTIFVHFVKQKHLRFVGPSSLLMANLHL
jgi:hypothetical protein